MSILELICLQLSLGGLRFGLDEVQLQPTQGIRVLLQTIFVGFHSRSCVLKKKIPTLRRELARLAVRWAHIGPILISQDPNPGPGGYVTCSLDQGEGLEPGLRARQIGPTRAQLPRPRHLGLQLDLNILP